MPPRLSIPSALTLGKPLPSTSLHQDVDHPEPPQTLSVPPRSLRSRSADIIPGGTQRQTARLPPMTAPPAALSSPTRARAHTVSVSMRSARKPLPSGTRRSPTLLGDSDDVQAGAGRAGRGSSSSRSERNRSPVSFEMSEQGGELDDHVVGMLDVIDDRVSTGKSSDILKDKR